MSNEDAMTSVAVAVGRVEEAVKNVDKNLETHSTNYIGFQQSTAKEFDVVHGRITKVEHRVTDMESTAKTNFRWISIMVPLSVTVVTVIVNLLMRG